MLPFSSKVRFLCGDQDVGWSELNATSRVALIIIGTPGIESDFLVGAQKPVSKLINFRSRRVQHILSSFLDILQSMRHTECFDPRDKVYAPLCLAPDDVRSCIRPDYTSNMTVLNVYKNVVQYYLTLPGHYLDFLGHTMYMERAQTVETPQGVKFIVPSWVPNWSASLEIYPIPKVLHVPENLEQTVFTFYDKRGIPSNKEALIAAYRPLVETPSRSFIDDNMLCVCGVYIDVLKDIISNTGPDLETVRGVARKIGGKWAMDAKRQYFTSESFADAINRTIVLDLVYDGLNRPSECGGKFDNAVLRKPRTELNLMECQKQMRMKTAQIRASISRNLGLSQKLYLLMIPNTAVVGDAIWALAGGQVLYILRPIDRERGRYSFVGECYAHGLMDGEIVRRLDRGEARMEDISLI